MNEMWLKTTREEEKRKKEDILDHIMNDEFIATPETLLFYLYEMKTNQTSVKQFMEKYDVYDEEYIKTMLYGLSTNYSDFISYSDTLGLDVINLHKTKNEVKDFYTIKILDENGDLFDTKTVLASKNEIKEKYGNSVLSIKKETKKSRLDGAEYLTKDEWIESRVERKSGKFFKWLPWHKNKEENDDILKKAMTNVPKVMEEHKKSDKDIIEKLDNGYEIRYNNETGMGSFGKLREGGKIMRIKPYQYEFLTPAIKESDEKLAQKTEEIAEKIKTGTPVAMPALEVTISKEYPKTLIIIDHEGRHRARALARLGAKSIPVVLIGNVPNDLTDWEIIEQYGRKKEPVSSNKLSEWGK